MKRKAICLLALSFSLLSACNLTSSNENNSIPSVVHDGKTSKLLKDPNIKYNSFDYSLTTEGYGVFLDNLSTFSADLTEKYFEDVTDVGSNISISPLSIYMAFAMAIECVANNTRQELLDALGMSYQEISDYSKTLFEQSCKEIYSNKDLVTKELLTNSLWFEKTLDIKEAAIDALAEKYYCYSHAVDFKQNSKKVIDIVYDFINEKTNGLIKHKGDYDSQTLMVILNTLYIKDLWNELGNELNKTAKVDFTNANKQVVQKELLEGYYIKGRKVKFDDFSTFYTQTNSGYKIKFMLPNDNVSAKSLLTKENIDKVNKLDDYKAIDNENKKIYHTKCEFPEYESSCEADLLNLFRNKYNVNEFFSNADFSNISDEPMACSSIIHKTKLKVEAKGIEGAAITAMEIKATSAFDGLEGYQDVYETFTINRDFGFIVTDRYDVMLFTGIVNK